MAHARSISGISRPRLDAVAPRLIEVLQDVSERPAGRRAGLVKDHVISKVVVERRAWLHAIGDNHPFGLNRKERLGEPPFERLLVENLRRGQIGLSNFHRYDVQRSAPVEAIRRGDFYARRTTISG
jgi:hypothetical protein